VHICSAYCMRKRRKGAAQSPEVLQGEVTWAECEDYLRISRTFVSMQNVLSPKIFYIAAQRATSTSDSKHLRSRH
jgi:hypothetical protein